MIVLGIAYSQVWRGDIIERREVDIYRIEVWGFGGEELWRCRVEERWRYRREERWRYMWRGDVEYMWRNRREME